MNRKRFERLLERALARIPEPFRQAMDNLAVLVEDWPEPALMEEMYGDPETYVYGIFTGTALPDRRVGDSGDLPAVIRIFQGALENDFEETGELEAELEITLVHEIAHFLGMDEEQLEALGYG